MDLSFDIRPITPADDAAIVGVVAACYARHEGLALDLEGWDRDLPRYHRAIHEQGGQAWVAHVDGRVAGFVSIVPHERETIELKKLYVHPDHWGSRIGAALLDLAVTTARSMDASSMFLWSETRLLRGHRFYEKHGWVRQPELKQQPDGSMDHRFVFHLSRGGDAPLESPAERSR